MEAKQQLEQLMQEEQIRAALNAHWHASAVGDANAERDIYDDDAVCDYPQPDPEAGKRMFAASTRKRPGEGVFTGSEEAEKY